MIQIHYYANESNQVVLKINVNINNHIIYDYYIFNNFPISFLYIQLLKYINTEASLKNMRKKIILSIIMFYKLIFTINSRY